MEIKKGSVLPLDILVQYGLGYRAQYLYLYSILYLKILGHSFFTKAQSGR